jgi:hypothetical protein
MRKEGDEKEMKRIKGGTKIVRGQMPVNTANQRITLFDGKFTTGFKVVRFEIWPKKPLSNLEFSFILSTQQVANIIDNNFQDVTQIGWAATDTNNTKFQDAAVLDPEAIIIEDLYITNRGSTDDTFCNYIIELEKYEFTAWDGASNMVRNQSQAGPPS